MDTYSFTTLHCRCTEIPLRLVTLLMLFTSWQDTISHSNELQWGETYPRDHSSRCQGARIVKSEPVNSSGLALQAMRLPVYHFLTEKIHASPHYGVLLSSLP